MTATTEVTAAVAVSIPPVYFIIGASVAVLFLCLSLLLWRQSSSPNKGPRKASSNQATSNLLGEETDPVDVEAEDETTKKVTILFGTQTGTAEGFAKVLTVLRMTPLDSTVCWSSLMPFNRSLTWQAPCSACPIATGKKRTVH